MRIPERRAFYNKPLNQDDPRTKHGMSRTLVYHRWVQMRRRCNKPKARGYSQYGGRGIRVCERWDRFENFLEDMGHPPTMKHTLDRIDVNGQYEPSNCRWATNDVQSNNRRDNHFVTVDGETLTLAQWARRNGLKKVTVTGRLRYGWSERDAVTLPVVTKERSSRTERVDWLCTHVEMWADSEDRINEIFQLMRRDGLFSAKTQAYDVNLNKLIAIARDRLFPGWASNPIEKGH